MVLPCTGIVIWRTPARWTHLDSEGTLALFWNTHAIDAPDKRTSALLHAQRLT